MAFSSSPLSSPPPSSSSPSKSMAGSNLPPTPPPRREYRSPRALPFELSQQVLTYFEESLYTQALTLLTSLVSSVACSAPGGPYAPAAFVPAPTYLALAATMAVHPSLTTRSTSQEKLGQANAALRLLRLMHIVVGPVGADFAKAFAFKKFGASSVGISRRSGMGRRNHGDVEGGVTRDDAAAAAAAAAAAEADEEAAEKLETPFSGSGSLWSRAEDFWQVVGWAFNCACLKGMHTQRWQRWSLFLEFMLQVLEDDWALWDQRGECEGSVIWQFIDHNTSVGQGRNRRILRAIFADGSTKSTNEFRVVFRNELREPTSDADRVKKREVNVNVDQEIYGDYLMRDEDDLSEEEEAIGSTKTKRTREPSNRRVTPRHSTTSLRDESSKAEPEPSPTLLGGVECLRLRMRLLHLLSNVALRLPKIFTSLDDINTLFVEFIKPLPLPTFQLFVSPLVLSAFSPDAHCTLCEVLLQRMLETAAPTVRKQHALTQTKMEGFYLPYAANTASYVENAKVSLLLEALLRNLAMAGKLARRSALDKALRKGIEARAEKAINESRKGASTRKDAGAAKLWLIESGERMLDVVQWLD